MVDSPQHRGQRDFFDTDFIHFSDYKIIFSFRNWHLLGFEHTIYTLVWGTVVFCWFSIASKDLYYRR
jgi:hypothetical protein